MLIILHNTPIWVWCLLAFLIYRGLQALRPREMTPQRMLLLPVLFLVWALSGIVTDVKNWPIALVSCLVMLIAGAMLGSRIAQGQPPAYRDGVTGLINRPGSPITLVLICLGFSLKYALAVVLAEQSDMARDPGFCAVFGGVGGFVDGIFWGLTAAQLAAALQTGGTVPGLAWLCTPRSRWTR